MAESIVVNVRLPRELLAALDIMAKEDLRTRSSLVQKILTLAVREYEGKLIKK